MKKAFKIIGIVLLVLIVGLIATPFLFKDKLIAIVKEEANKNLKIDHIQKNYERLLAI